MTKAFVKIFSTEFPISYHHQMTEATKFVNKLFEAGIPKSDIKIFQSAMPYYKDKKQFTKIFISVLYYFHQEIK